MVKNRLPDRQRKNQCGACKNFGHNKRTCSQLKPSLVVQKKPEPLAIKTPDATQLSTHQALKKVSGNNEDNQNVRHINPVTGFSHEKPLPEVKVKNLKVDKVDGVYRVTQVFTVESEDGVPLETFWEESGAKFFNATSLQTIYVDNEGLLHRENDQPAHVYDKNKKSYFKHGLIHRDNGLPAVVNGSLQEWWVDGKLHRIGGPAHTVRGSGNSWYFKGEKHNLRGYAEERYVRKRKVWVTEYWVGGKKTNDVVACNKVFNRSTTELSELIPYTKHEDFVVRNLAYRKLLDKGTSFLEESLLYQMCLDGCSEIQEELFALDEVKKKGWHIAAALIKR